MAQNKAFTARASQLALNKGQFGAALGLVTAAAQFLCPYHGPLSVLTTTPGSIIVEENQSLIQQMRVRFTGDAANVAGQTLTFQLYADGVAVTAGVSTALATTAGVKVETITFATAVVFTEHTVLTCTATPSVTLTAAVTGITVALG